MSNRNLVLLIIFLVIAVAIVFGLIAFIKPETPEAEDTGGTNFFSNFNPFGNNKTTSPNTTPPTDISGEQEEADEELLKSQLTKISSMPIAGFVVFMKERYKEVFLEPAPVSGGETPQITIAPPATEFAPALRYVERATGHIHQTFADEINERRFSQTTIPKVYEAYFGNKGESVIMRYLKEDNRTIQTFFGNLPKEYLGADVTSTDEIIGSFLPDNVSDMSMSPDTTKIFYLFNSAGVAIGTTMEILTGKKVQVFDSPFTQWLSLWPNSKMITVTTKPSAEVLGFMYAINPDKKDFNKILGGISGLTTLTSPDGKSVLYGDNTLSLNVYRVDTGTFLVLGVRTLPEKCVWGLGSEVVYCAVPKLINRASYPDQWYQGEVSFSDEIWKIDTITGNTTKLLDPIEAIGGVDTDGIKLALDEGENYLFFVNKKDSFLWELQLK